MSCITTFITPATCYMVGDSRLSNQSSIIPSNICKIYTGYKNMMMGFTGSLKTIQTIYYLLSTNKVEFSENSYNDVIKLAMDLEKVLKTIGEVKLEEESKSRYMDAEIVIVGNDYINVLAENFAVLPIKDKFHSIGDGASYVLGAIEVSKITSGDDIAFYPSTELVRLSMEACARYCSSVSGPFETFSVPNVIL